MEYIKLSEEIYVDVETGVYYHFVDSDNEDFRPHCHEYYEIMVFLNDAYHILNGEKRLEKKGTVMLLKPADKHYLLRDLKFSMHNIAFSSNCAKALFEYYGINKQKVSVVVSTSELQRINSSIRKIQTLNITDKKQQGIMFKKFISEIYAKYFAIEHNEVETTVEWLDMLNAQMKYPENFIGGIERMEQLSGKSREHICRSYKKYMNTTPSKFLSDIKLNYAANLIINSNLPIIDISLESGFENLAWFYELFKKKFGKTPNQFRKMGDGV